MTDFSLLDATGGVGEEAAKAVIAAGHPPIAEGLFLIDFDSTIAPFGMMFEFPKPFDGVAEFTKSLKKKGYRIGIFTSRLSPKWLESAKQNEQDHIDYITEYGRRYGIEFDFITSEKVPSLAYIDDKAIEFKGNWMDIFVRFVSEGWL